MPRYIMTNSEQTILYQKAPTAIALDALPSGCVALQNQANLMANGAVPLGPVAVSALFNRCPLALLQSVPSSTGKQIVLY